MQYGHGPSTAAFARERSPAGGTADQDSAEGPMTCPTESPQCFS